MDKINVKDINISELSLLDKQGTKGKVYVKDGICYKYLVGLYPGEKDSIYKKFRNMEGLALDNVIMPKDLIMDGDRLVGYTMDYFTNSINLYDYFTRDRFIDARDILDITAAVSKILKNAHENELMFLDFDFDNILIDKNKKIMISDIDGCSFKGYDGPFVSQLVSNFLELYKGNNLIIDYNLDRLSLMLTMIVSLYHKELKYINEHEYDNIAEKMNDLKKLKSVIFTLKKCKSMDIPYLDDMITGSDHYVIDRNKQVSIIKALKKDYSIE